MQDSSVGWDPISVDRQLPYQERLFVLYLLVVLGMAIIRSVSMARQLWFAGPLSKNNKGLDGSFLYTWEMCFAKAAGMKRMVVLTLLLALVMLTDGVTNVLVWIAREKLWWHAAIAGGLVEVGHMLTLGVFVSALLYGVSSFYEGVLERRRASWNRARSSDQ